MVNLQCLERLQLGYISVVRPAAARRFLSSQLLGMRLLLVRAAVGAVGKGAVAKIAGVRLQSSVQDEVILQRLGALKLPAAVVALVLHLIRVHQSVAIQGGPRIQLHSAFGADVLVRIMRLLVVFQTIGRLKALLAHLALEGGVVRVLENVLLERAHRVHTHTALLANHRPRPLIQVHVLLVLLGGCTGGELLVATAAGILLALGQGHVPFHVPLQLVV